jgi:hypothetical protein
MRKNNNERRDFQADFLPLEIKFLAFHLAFKWLPRIQWV